MKGLLKRYGWDLVLLCNVFLMSLFFMMIVSKYENIYQTQNQSSDTINNTSIHFIVDTYYEIDFSFLEEIEDTFALLQRQSQSMPIYKVICSNAYFEVSSGRSFEKSDFNKSINNVICGARAGDILQTEPFVFRENEYTTIGTLSDKNVLESKYAVFYTNGDIDRILARTELILVGIKQKDIEKIFMVITDKLRDVKYAVNRIDIKTTKVKDVYDTNEKSLSIVILVIIFNCTSILLLNFFWLGQFDEFHYVYNLIGKRGLEKEIYLRFLLIILLGYFIALFCQKIKSISTSIATFILISTIMLIILSCEIRLKERGEWNEKDY